jgi:hypothetical protein
MSKRADKDTHKHMLDICSHFICLTTRLRVLIALCTSLLTEICYSVQYRCVTCEPNLDVLTL